MRGVIALLTAAATLPWPWAALAAGPGPGSGPAPRPIAMAPRGAPASAPSPDTATGLTPDQQADEDFRARAEADVLRKLGAAKGRRDCLRLMLFTEQSRPVMLDSRRPEPGDTDPLYIDYRLDGLSADQAFYIVRVTLTAGTEVLWIARKSGERYLMHGNAYPSPDGSHLVVTQASPGLGFSGIVVWARDGDRLVERYKYQAPPDQQAVSFRFMRWRDATTVELEQFAEVDPATCAVGTLESLAVLARQQTGGWILRSSSGPRCQG